MNKDSQASAQQSREGAWRAVLEADRARTDARHCRTVILASPSATRGDCDRAAWACRRANDDYKSALAHAIKLEANAAQEVQKCRAPR